MSPTSFDNDQQIPDWVPATIPAPRLGPWEACPEVNISVTAVHMRRAWSRHWPPSRQSWPSWKSVCCCSGGGCLLSIWNSQHIWVWLQALGKATIFSCLSLSTHSRHFPFGLGVQPQLLSKRRLLCFLLNLCLPVEKTNVFLVGCRCEHDTCRGWEGTGKTVGLAQLCPQWPQITE